MAKNASDYELLDFGDGRKLERFGKMILDRPEILAKGKPDLPRSQWNSLSNGRYVAQGQKSGKWIDNKGLSEVWKYSFPAENDTIEAELKPGKYKHVGIFPEQEKHWKFIRQHVKPGTRMLNLFGYTGMASLVAAKAGADVFHNDSSRSIIRQAARNAQLSGIDTIHWVCEDALKFAQREAKRQNHYDFIIMDPPVFGRGKRGEKWRLEDLLPKLVKTTAEILNPGGYLILNTYSPKIALDTMRRLMSLYHLDCVESGMLSVRTANGRKLELSKFTLAKQCRGA